MRLYFVRHGESQANLRHQFANQINDSHPLTEQGRAQAQALAEKLRRVPVTAIYSSPLLRARQTAEILNGPHGLEIQIEPALREHDPGELEGRSDPAAWKQYAELFETWILKGDRDARIPGGESWNELHGRFAPFLEGLVARYHATDAHLVLVAHAGILHAMLPAFLSNVDYRFGYEHILSNSALVIAQARPNGLYCESWDGVELELAGRAAE